MNEQQRLRQIMESQGLNAKDFAEQVGISPATMSNILGGRNNPSLDVFQKVLRRFRNVSSDWLILGVGTMSGEKNDSRELNLFDSLPEETDIQEVSVPKPQKVEKSLPAQKTLSNAEKPLIPASGRTIAKVIVFYTDGTFDELV